MKNFDYFSPSSMDEACSLLGKFKQDAMILAGGTDLAVQMKEGRAKPAVLIDAKNIPELNRLELKGSVLHIGAAVPLSKLTAFKPLKDNFAILYQGCSVIGSVQIRNRASMGGNICNAAPSADSVPPLLCLDANAVLMKSGKSRKVALNDFFKGPGKTVREPDELLVEIEVPLPPSSSSGCYLRHTPREEMDIGIVGVAAFIVADKDNVCRKARIALASVAPTPVIAHEAGDFLAGKPLTEKIISEASELAAKASSPISDIRGSAGYRSEMVRVLTGRALARCHI